MRKLEVLAIEDNPADLACLEFVLEEIGLQCRLWPASDGEQALDYLLKRGSCVEAPAPDLIFLDVHLPKLNGIEILRKVQNAQELPICVLTSSAEERKIFRDEFGIRDPNYLIKPVNSQDLRQCPRVRAYIEAFS